MRTLIRFIFLLIYITAVVSLLFVYIGMYISPEKHWYIALSGLAYPFILVINIFFVFFWFILGKKYLSLVSLIMILIRVDLIFSVIQPSKDAVAPNANDIKCMTYNVKNFGLYSWENNKMIRDKIFAMVKTEQPDILCFQEFFHTSKHNFSTLDTLLSFKKNKQNHIYYNRNFLHQYFGIAIFTVYPIVDKGGITFPNTSNSIIWVDLNVGTKIIRVYNCHLESFRIDNASIQKIKTLPNPDKPTENYDGVLLRLKTGFQKRANQAEELAKHIAQSPHPVIVMGDFNDTPFSYTYRTIANAVDLKDAFKTAGSSFGGTYAGKLPSFRIDYILYDKSFKASNYRVERTRLSDHFPVICNINIE